MFDQLQKLASKKQKKMTPNEMHAKMSALGGIKDEADKVMNDDVSGLPKLKKVSVLSTDKHGLEEGLDKAKELVGEDGDDEHEGGVDELDKASREDNEMEEEKLHPGIHAEVAKHLMTTAPHDGDEHEDDEEVQPSLDAIEAKIAHLMEMKKHMKR